MLEQGPLDLNAKHWWLVGREREVAILEEVVERAKLGSRELVFIEGPSGAGKASIVQYLSHGHKSLFANGKFGANPNSPFAAIVGACVDFISSICRDEFLRDEVSNSMSCSDDMNDTDVSTLVTFLPTFQHLIVKDENRTPRRLPFLCRSESTMDDRKDLLTKIKFALRAFLRIVTKHSTLPVILYLQDLQWADDASLDILEFIASDPDQTQFIVAVTTTTLTVHMDETDMLGQRARLWKERVSKSKAINVIQVEHLTLAQFNTFLSVVMRMREADTLKLATHLMTRSAGDVFAALHILEEWRNQNTLIYNCSTSQWKWDLEKVRNTAIPKQLVDLVSNRIQRLPPNVQRLLRLSACLGDIFEPTLLHVIKEALPGEPLNVDSVLNICFEESLLELQGDGRVMFLHETIHKACLLHLPQGDGLARLHLRIGLLIWNHLKSIATPLDSMLFVSADHLVMGLDHIDDNAMMLEVAELCNTVGKKAIEVSAFIVAANYFAKGIELLNKISGSKWMDYHDLTQSMFVSIAEVQYYNGKFDASVEAIEELLSNNPSEPAFVRANLTRLEILKAECKLKEFVASSLAFLQELGVTFPSHFICVQSYLQRRRVMEKLNGMDDEAILNLPRVTELNLIAIFKVLNLMTIPVETLGLVHLSSLILHKAVHFNITKGVSELSPEAFVIFGTFLISERGMLAEGYRLGQLALSMSQKLDPSTLDCRVVFWAYSMTSPWQGTPLVACIPPMLLGHASALTQGDPFTAFMLINNFFSMSYFSSKELPLLLREIEKFSSQMLEYGQKTIFLQILPIWQCVLNLSGLSDDPCNMDSGEAMNKQHLVGNENAVGEQARWSYLLQISFYMGNVELASRMSAKLQSLNIGFMKAHVLYQARVFFFGLVAIENARLSGKRKYVREAAKHISVMRRWVEKKAVNLEHKLSILEAEYESLSVKNSEQLRSRYDAAIQASVKSKFMQDAALATQLASRAMQRSDDGMAYAESYIISAYEIWVSWGALAVAKFLEEDARLYFPGISLDLSQFESEISSKFRQFKGNGGEVTRWEMPMEASG